MKKLFTFLFLAVFTLGVNAQFAIDFEADNTATWEVFGNNGSAPNDFDIIANPSNSGTNTSDSVLQFIVTPGAETWVGAWSDSFGPFTFTEASHLVTMLVHKTVISDCAIKLEGAGLPNAEVHAANTLIGEWEKLTFDFSAAIGLNYTRFVLFPDFPDVRTSGSTVYIDNILQIDPTAVNPLSEARVRVYPNPASDVLTVEQPGMISLSISNLLGKKVISLNFSATDNKSVDLNDLNTGIYMITIETAKGIFSSKFIKK